MSYYQEAVNAVTGINEPLGHRTVITEAEATKLNTCRSSVR